MYYGGHGLVIAIRDCSQLCQLTGGNKGYHTMTATQRRMSGRPAAFLGMGFLPIAHRVYLSACHLILLCMLNLYCVLGFAYHIFVNPMPLQVQVKEQESL